MSSESGATARMTNCSRCDYAVLDTQDKCPECGLPLDESITYWRRWNQALSPALRTRYAVFGSIALAVVHAAPAFGTRLQQLLAAAMILVLAMGLLRLTLIIFTLYRRPIIVGAFGIAVTCAFLIFTIFPQFLASLGMALLGSRVMDDGNLTLGCFSLDMACYFFLLSAVIRHSQLRRAVVHPLILCAAWTLICCAAVYLDITDPFPSRISFLLNITSGSTLAIGIYTLGFLLRMGYLSDIEKIDPGVSGGD